MSIEQLFALELTPEMMQRLRVLSTEIVKMLQDRTTTPEEALIVLDHVMKQLCATYGLALLSPIDDTNTGHHEPTNEEIRQATDEEGSLLLFSAPSGLRNA